MIENQSDNIDNKENDDSNQDNAPDDTSSTQNSTTEIDDLSSQKTEEINTEELKNTISNNDARRLEQLEKEHETLKNQYVRISADFDNFRKRVKGSGRFKNPTCFKNFNCNTSYC